MATQSEKSYIQNLAQQAVSKPTVYQEPSATSSTSSNDPPRVYRYPQKMLDSKTDYIKIDCLEYKPPGVGDLNNFNFTIPTSDTNYQTISKKDIRGTLILPVPQTIPGNSQSVAWNSGSLNPITAAGIGIAQETIEEGVGGLTAGVSAFINKVKGAAMTGIGQQAIKNFFATQAVQVFQKGGGDLFGELLTRETGAVINENVELLFRGVNLRGDLNFGFELAPRDPKESREILDMVRFLKKEMSARKGAKAGAAGGLFLTAPSVFKIQYMSGGQPHPYLNRFKICALTALTLNFTGSNVYSTYPDGTPVIMNLSLSFQELTPIYAEDYESGEGQTAIGY